MYGDLFGIIVECLHSHLNTNKVCASGSHPQRNPPTLEAPTRGDAEDRRGNRKGQSANKESGYIYIYIYTHIYIYIYI